MARCRWAGPPRRGGPGARPRACSKVPGHSRVPRGIEGVAAVGVHDPSGITERPAQPAQGGMQRVAQLLAGLVGPQGGAELLTGQRRGRDQQEQQFAGLGVAPVRRGHEGIAAVHGGRAERPDRSGRAREAAVDRVIRGPSRAWRAAGRGGVRPPARGPAGPRLRRRRRLAGRSGASWDGSAAGRRGGPAAPRCQAASNASSPSAARAPARVCACCGRSQGATTVPITSRIASAAASSRAAWPARPRASAGQVFQHAGRPPPVAQLAVQLQAAAQQPAGRPGRRGRRPAGPAAPATTRRPRGSRCLRTATGSPPAARRRARPRPGSAPPRPG